MRSNGNVATKTPHGTLSRFTVSSIPHLRVADISERAGSVKVDPVTTMINTRKLIVLDKAIKAVEQSGADELHLIAHEMGGAIAFYTYVEEGRELTALSRWLEANPGAPLNEIESRRATVLQNMREKREKDGK